MKLFELTITRRANRRRSRRRGAIEHITIRREAEERLTKDQKFYIIMALIALAALIAGLHLIGWKALVGALGALLMFGFYKLITSV